MAIEDHALIGDTQTAALVARDGSIDWLCLPRFDSGACFAALLGDERHGHWRLAPAAGPFRATRRYVPGTLVLETTFTNAEGTVRLLDLMPPRAAEPDLVRIVEGVEGRVAMHLDLVVRFDYGDAVPWVTRSGGVLRAVCGPDALHLFTPVPTEGEDLSTIADFSVEPGDRVPFTLVWAPSHLPVPEPVDAFAAATDTIAWWQEWSGRARRAEGEEPARAALVERSLITLKALTFQPTGGIVAAPTTSLPEWIGGVRNWDYRFCWLRDATFTLYSLMQAGYVQEAVAWRDWLLRAVAGDPARLQIMYGPAGERRLTELELPHLPGHRGSRPVRVGNAASTQFQLDVFGEVADALHETRRVGIPPDEESWELELELLDYLESAWRRPDEGIWEVRGPRRHFTHSKVMAWVAFDRAVQAVTAFGRPGPVERWAALRDEVHAEVCREGFDAERGTFTQFYGSRQLDAAALMIPLVGFLPASDLRVAGTVAAIERELTDATGLVRRYSEGGSEGVDGLPRGEGAFLPCAFWLADNHALAGRWARARELFHRLAGYANDVGLLSEEVDPATGRMLGNFPQAFSHVSLINSARNIALGDAGPAARRTRAAGDRTHDRSTREAAP
jgi:GH15 family glucan-1,4-alpha-glucosidase